jgi:hypothetical protein
MPDDIKGAIRAYLTTKKIAKDVISVSGMLNELGIKQRALLQDPEIYSMIKSSILQQSIRIPKHAHESIMEDFNQVMGERIIEDALKVKKITNISIDIDDFKKESEKTVITEDMSANGGFEDIG